MLTLFSGPPQDMGISDALRHIQNSPSLVVDFEEQRKRYAKRFLENLENHSNYRVCRFAPTVLISSGIKIDVLKILYPPETPKPGPRWEWNTNESKNRRIPYFRNLF